MAEIWRLAAGSLLHGRRLRIAVRPAARHRDRHIRVLTRLSYSSQAAPASSDSIADAKSEADVPSTAGLRGCHACEGLRTPCVESKSLGQELQSTCPKWLHPCIQAHLGASVASFRTLANTSRHGNACMRLVPRASSREVAGRVRRRARGLDLSHVPSLDIFGASYNSINRAERTRTIKEKREILKDLSKFT